MVRGCLYHILFIHLILPEHIVHRKLQGIEGKVIMLAGIQNQAGEIREATNKNN